MGRRVLVTGGAGFIGSHLAAALIQRGFEVTVVDNLSTGRRDAVPAGARFLLADVTDHSALAAAFDPVPEVVCHIAGQASNIRSFHDPHADFRVNVGGTVNVVQHAVAHRVPRVVYASSMMVYGAAERIPTPETESCRPTSYYGISKYAAERFVHATGLRPDLDAPLDVTSFRMFNVYGEGQSVTNPYQGVLAIFIGQAIRGEPITIHSDGRQSRDFVHIDDVVEAWVRALDAAATYGEAINLGEGVARSVNELADVALKSVGRERATSDVRYAPERPGDLRHTAADIAKAKRLLGWKPTVSFEDGVRRVTAWARSHDAKI